MRNILLAAVAVSAIAAPAFAQTNPEPRGYGSLGYTHLEGDNATTGAVTGRLGVNLNRYIAVETEASVGVKHDDFTVAGVDGEIKHEWDAAGYVVGKVPVSCGDRAGFIVNALLFPYLNDAVKMLEAHYATADDIDTAMKYGCALPMGPFELLDVVGNDVALAIQRELYLEFREPGFAPAPLLEHLVTAGYLGRKTGRGFRDYSHR